MKNAKKTCVTLLFTLVMLLACAATVNAKTYYSYQQLGITKGSSAQMYHIVSVSGGKVSYQKVTTIDAGYGIEVKKGKVKTAKITSKTKFYLGSYTRYYQKLQASGYSSNDKTIKWIYKVSKSKFKSQLNDTSWWDRIVVKNGKAVAVCGQMQLAS